ncbi:MAG TPA: DUF350 domain-containing protein [Thermoanaerobaculia bacterium]|jgi:hypothetical protein
MRPFDLPSILAGLLACGVAVFAGTTLVFIVFRLNTMLRHREEQERLLLSGHRSIAIALGATILSQALLLRHVVFPVMAVMRDLFLERASLFTLFTVAGQCGIFFLVIGAVSIGSVWVAGWLFDRMTGSLPEQSEILRDNVAVAIFYAFVLLAITVILNEGIEDLSRSLIPYGRAGVVRLP